MLVSPEELDPSRRDARVFLALPEGEGDNNNTSSGTSGTAVRVPPALAFGIREREERMLFEHLPLLTAEMKTRHSMLGGGSGANDHHHHQGKGMGMDALSAFHETQLAAGRVQANELGKLLDLRNASAAGIAFENRRRIVEAFSEPGKPNDTGRTEVQGVFVVTVCSATQKPL